MCRKEEQHTLAYSVCYRLLDSGRQAWVTIYDIFNQFDSRVEKGGIVQLCMYHKNKNRRGFGARLQALDAFQFAKGHS